MQRQFKSSTYANSDVDVLGEDNTLRLDDEEVDELLEIIRHALERGLWNGEVLSWPKLGGEATSNGQLPRDLGSSSSTKNHVRSLEHVADQVQVA